MIKPTNEMETILLFERTLHSRYQIMSFNPTGFPDAVVLDIVSGKQYRTEFEYLASSFIEHGHNPGDCDLIICWKNNLDKTIRFPVWEIETMTFGDVFTPSSMEVENFALRIENYMLARKIRREAKVKPDIENGSDWRKVSARLSAKQIEEIANGDTGTIQYKYGITERTARNWRKAAAGMLSKVDK